MISRLGFVLLVAGAVLLGYTEAQVGNCHKIDSCACVYDDGVIVNLTQLSRNDGRPNFNNVSDSHNDVYSWNPCTPFTIEGNGSTCQNVAVCMIRQGIPRELFYDLGTQDSAEFHVDENKSLILTYTADKGDFKRTAVILLQCMATAKFDYFVIQGEQDEANDTINYKMTLASKWACAFAPTVNPALPVTENNLSGGAVVGIVLGSLLGAYLILGVLYQGLIMKETGLRLLPNYDFWANIPSKLSNCGGKKTEPLAQSGPGPKYETIE